jgi:hypothetical protein
MSSVLIPTDCVGLSLIGFKNTLEKTEEEIENGQIQRQLQYWAHTQDTRRRQPTTTKYTHTTQHNMCWKPIYANSHK